MASQLSENAKQQLDIFCRQFLQVQLEIELDYPDNEYLRNDAFQQCIYSRLFKPDALEYAPPERYQFRALKELTTRIENSIQDPEEEGVSDDLMNHFAELLSTPATPDFISVQQKSYVTYTISSLASESKPTPTITILESRNLLTANGTTGLRTWEGALFLGNYLAHNSSMIRDKHILELGAGTGYLSILCAKYLGASHVLATDGPDDLVANLPTNFYLNGLEESQLITAKELKWGHALVGSEHPAWNDGRPIDVVLGADITFDDSLFPPLLSTFDDLFELYPKVKIVLAATIRNPQTFQTFLDLCRRKKYNLTDEPFTIEKQEGPFFPAGVPFKICIITRSS